MGVDVSESVEREDEATPSGLIFGLIVARFGLPTSYTDKVRRWSLVPGKLDAVVLRDSQSGGVFIPWDRERDAKPYFGTVREARFDQNGVVKQGRHSNIVSGVPSLGWEKDILELRPSTLEEAKLVVEFIEAKRDGRGIGPVSPPERGGTPLASVATGNDRSISTAIPWDVARAVMDRDGRKCVECGCVESLSFDHIIPQDRGGASTIVNLRILCQRCNSRKNNRV